MKKATNKEIVNAYGHSLNLMNKAKRNDDLLSETLTVSEFKTLQKKSKVKNGRLVSKDEYVNKIKKLLDDAKIDYYPEWRFHDKRRWRFDIAIFDKLKTYPRIAIEYEGINSTKSRHTTIKGFTGDCEKYNAAALLGWKVLRYTAMNYKNVISDLEKLLK